MTREIKFRGKSICGDEWCYGTYIFTDDNRNDPFRTRPFKESHKIVFWCSGDWNMGGWVDEEVDPDTVGQFTCLKDKNGKEIYEGDIVYSEFADGSNCMFLVGWNNKLSCFGVMDEHDYRSKQLGYDFPEFDNHLFIEVLKNSKIFKIIGNIHDNPELLTEK